MQNLLAVEEADSADDLTASIDTCLDLSLDGSAPVGPAPQSRGPWPAAMKMKAAPAGSPLRASGAIVGLPRSRLTPIRSNSASPKLLTLIQYLARPET